MIPARLTTTALVAILALPAFAQTQNITAHKLQSVPPLSGWVNDLADLLTPQEESHISAALAKFSSLVGPQVVVLTIRTTYPEDIDHYSLRVVNNWGIGRKNINDGVLITVARDDRRVRIEVGMGLESVLDNETCAEIIEVAITPRFKEGKYYEGITAGTRKVMDRLSAHPIN